MYTIIIRYNTNIEWIVLAYTIGLNIILSSSP